MILDVKEFLPGAIQLADHAVAVEVVMIERPRATASDVFRKDVLLDK
jgi:hypothetical protein